MSYIAKPYFRGYEMEQYIVSEKEYCLLEAAYWMVDNRATIRETALNCGFAKSTLHSKLQTELKTLSPELYRCVRKQIGLNWKNRGKKRK